MSTRNLNLRNDDDDDNTLQPHLTWFGVHSGISVLTEWCYNEGLTQSKYR